MLKTEVRKRMEDLYKVIMRGFDGVNSPDSVESIKFYVDKDDLVAQKAVEDTYFSLELDNIDITHYGEGGWSFTIEEPSKDYLYETDLQKILDKWFDDVEKNVKLFLLSRIGLNKKEGGE